MKKAILILAVLLSGYFSYGYSCNGDMSDPSARKRCLYNYVTHHIESYEKQLASEYKKLLNRPEKLKHLYIRGISPTLTRLNVFYELLHHVNPQKIDVIIKNQAPIVVRQSTQ